MLWNKCLETLRTDLPESMFSLWILPLTVKTEDMQQGVIELLAPNKHFCDHITNNYLEKMQNLATKYHGAPVAVSIDVDNKSPVETEKTEKKPATKKIKLNPLFTFEEFVVGESNLMAYQTTKEVQKNLGGNTHNPLFLYGPTGLGKTHLMQALGHEVQKKGKKVRFMTSEQFVKQFVASSKNNKVDEFAKKCRDTDLLMVDDIHFLAGKKGSTNTFLSLFNDLVSENKQIVLTSDKYPTAIDIDDRLKSRFAWGLSVAVEPPNLETRIDILVKKAYSQGVELPHDCAKFIAKQVIANVRELEGALNKVLATARFKSEPVSLEIVQFALKEIVQIRAEAISIANIQKVVAEYFNISVRDMVGKKRTRAIARPRQLAMTLTRELTKHSYPEIGNAFGKRDHTTVMHAYEKVQKLRENDPIFAKDYQTILAMMQS